MIVITAPERIVTSEVRLARFVLVRSRDPERDIILFSRERTRPERERFVFSLVAIRHERVSTVHERAFCARESVK